MRNKQIKALKNTKIASVLLTNLGCHRFSNHTSSRFDVISAASFWKIDNLWRKIFMYYKVTVRWRNVQQIVLMYNKVVHCSGSNRGMVVKTVNDKNVFAWFLENARVTRKFKGSRTMVTPYPTRSCKKPLRSSDFAYFHISCRQSASRLTLFPTTP